MSTSTDANLFYGFEIPGGEDGEKTFWESGGEDDWEDFVAAKLGILKPAVDYSEETKPLYETYWDTRNEAVAKCPCAVELHCSAHAPMYAVIVKVSTRIATRGYPIKLTPAELTIDPGWDQQLREFAELVGLEPSTPSWLLASYYG